MHIANTYEELVEAAKVYRRNGIPYRLFADDYCNAGWILDYCESEENEEITEQDMLILANVLRNAWNDAVK